MKAKRNLALVAAGIVIGAFLAFPTAHAAEELFTAVRSSHQFFLDGEKVQMEAYIINGNNICQTCRCGQDGRVQCVLGRSGVHGQRCSLHWKSTGSLLHT